MVRIDIIAAQRTPIGRFMGALSGKSAADLGTHAALATLRSCGVDPALVDLVVVGNVLGAGLGQNIARQIGLRAGLPESTPAYSVNMMCASGIQAVIAGIQAILSGSSQVALVGGAESMTNAPYLLEKARAGYKLGDGKIIDSMLSDGLIDAIHKEHMGVTAERLARTYNISRQDQDKFAFQSQQRAAEAMKSGRLADEIAPLKELDRDEHPRADTALEKLATLKPAFPPSEPGGPGGTVTPGNASGINDGAAMLLICAESTTRRYGWKPLASIGDTSWATVGCDPRTMGLGPVFATRKLCQARSWSPTDFDTVELNEAFAAQAMACIRELGLDESRVNPDGGAIAYGHPIGATGARLITHLAHRIRRGESKRSLATLCVGGGMGAAIAIEPA